MKTALSRFVFAAALFAAALATISRTAAASLPANSLQALAWRLIGPFHGGRADAITGVPEAPGTFYFGAADGGIWKSTDAGHSWRNVSDCCLTVGPVGALAVAPSDPHVIYAGTGEPFPRGDMNTGDGVWKSVDDGKTWQHVGLGRTRVIGRIVVDPRDADHVYVAALGHVFGPNPQRGVYETHDGGVHWKRILYVDAQTGAVDIAMNPDDPRTLYAALWQVSRRPWNFSSGGPGSGLYKTTDGGAHWTDISRNPGLPAGPLGKIGVAVAPSQPQRVYALIEAHAGGLFRSDDAGATWHRLYHGTDLTQRAFYFGRIYVDPADPDRLYAPQAEGLRVSTDGGAHFTNLYAQGGDNHALWIDPRNPEVIAVANDGGATVSLDRGRSWSREDNQPTGQFYHGNVDGRFPFHVYGAQQDFATIETASRDTSGYGIGREDWKIVAQWENGVSVPVPGEPGVSYSSGIMGILERYDEQTRQHLFVGPWPEDGSGHAAADLKYRFQWTFPVLVSSRDPKTLYIGSQYVMKSTDGGNSWTKISPDLTRNDKSKQIASGGPITKDITPVEYYDAVFALAESPLDARVLWAGTDDGKTWVSRDGGAHWRDVTPGGLPEWTTVSAIEASHFAAGTAYFAARRYRQDDYSPYVYATTDFGAHWRKITHGLPDDESSFVVREDVRDPQLLFAGTLRGVYVSFDRGGDWQPLRLNLPHVAVRDLAISDRQSALVAATHGRGFWVLDNLQPLREMSQKALAAPAFLFTPQTAWLTGGERDPDAGRYDEGENPPNGVTVFYELARSPATNETVTLNFSDASGNVIASFSSADKDDGVTTRAGMNEFVWNLRYPPEPVDGTAKPADSAPGPRAVPGTYRVTLAAAATTLARGFEIVKDPAIAATQDDLEARFALLRRIQRKLETVNSALVRIRALRKLAQQALAAAPATSATSASAGQRIAALDALHDALAQKDARGLASLQYPAGLREKLGMLFFVVDGSFARPTRSDYALWRALATQTDERLSALNRLAGN